MQKRTVYAKPIARPTSALYLILLAFLALTLVLPVRARAQNDAIRVMAERVLGNGGWPGSHDRDRDGGIWRDRNDDGRYENGRRGNERDHERWRRAQEARERYCRRNPRDRDCREFYSRGRSNNNNWCWDRNGDRRCDASARNRNGWPAASRGRR
jgi:hypothetical protein